MAKLNFKKNIPNILTIIRIIISIIVIVLILVPNNTTIYVINIQNNLFSLNVTFLIAFILFIVACITDFFDGFISRKYNCESNFGKFWDPIADKILTNCIMFSFSSLGYIPIYFCLIILVRDIIIEGLRINAISKKIIIKANILGKIKTFVFMIALGLIFLFHNNNINFWFYFGVQNLLIIISIILAISSLIWYSINYIKTFKDSNSKAVN